MATGGILSRPGADPVSLLQVSTISLQSYNSFLRRKIHLLQLLFFSYFISLIANNAVRKAIIDQLREMCKGICLKPTLPPLSAKMERIKK